jgi:hypothetical protein
MSRSCSTRGRNEIMYKISTKILKERDFWTPWIIWENNIKMKLKLIFWANIIECIDLAQDRETRK